VLGGHRSGRYTGGVGEEKEANLQKVHIPRCRLRPVARYVQVSTDWCHLWVRLRVAIPAMFLACSVTALCRLKLSLQITSVPISLFILNLFCILCCLLYDKYRLVANFRVGGAWVSAKGAKVEAPRGWVQEGVCPLRRKFLNFKNKNGVFRCTLEHGFYTQCACKRRQLKARCLHDNCKTWTKTS